MARRDVHLYPNTGRTIRETEIRYVRDELLKGNRDWQCECSKTLGRSPEAIQKLQHRFLPEMSERAHAIRYPHLSANPPVTQPVGYDHLPTVMARYEFRSEMIHNAIKRIERKIDLFLCDLGIAYVEADQSHQIGLWSDEDGG